MLLPHLTDVQISNPVCFSRPIVLPNLPLSVFIKLFKIFVTLQSPCFNFLNVCLDIMLSWWTTNAFPECLNAFYLWKLSSSWVGQKRVLSRWPIFLNNFTRGKKAILFQLVNGHSQVQFVIHNTEGSSVASHVQSQATATYGTFLFQTFCSWTSILLPQSPFWVQRT